MSSAGDNNGDGLDDLIIGAYGGKNDAGSSYVVFGQKVNNSPVELFDIAAGNGGFIIDGEYSSDRSGRSVSSAGDVNGDDLSDLLIGASSADNAAGRSYVIL